MSSFPVLAAPPANDNLADAIALSTTPHSVTEAEWSAATNEVGEVDCITTNAWWYKYTPTATGNFYVTSNGASGINADVRLGIYTGTAFPLTGVSCTDDDDGYASTSNTQGECQTISGVAATTYYIRIASGSASFGAIATSLRTSACPTGAPPPPAPSVSAPILNFNQPVVIYSEEINVTK